jgi:hypothetical protein
MKKILILILFLILGWAGSTWFIGNETESLLKTYLKNTKNASAEMGMETQYDLKEYKKSFLKSTAKTVVSLKTGDPQVDALLKDIQFNTVITHGPVLFVDGLPSFGTAYVHSTLDLEALTPDTKEIINTIFADKNPMTTNITFGIDDLADYEVIVPAMDVQEDESQFTLKEGISITGKINKTTLMGTATGTIGPLQVKNDGLIMKTSKTTLEVDMQGIVAGQMIGTSHFAIPSLQITGGALPPVSLGLDLTTDTRKAGEDALEGDIKLVASNIEAPVDINNISLSTSFKAFQIKGLQQLSAIQKDLKKLQAEAMNGGISDEKQQALLEKVQNLPNIMLAAVQNTLKKDTTSLVITADITSQQGSSLLALDTLYVGDSVDINLEKLLTGGLNVLLNVFNGSIDVSAPKAMVSSTPIAFFIPSLVEKGLIAESKDKYMLQASFKTDSVTLNGKSMSPNDFEVLFGTLGLSGANEALAPDVTSSQDAGVALSDLPPQLLEELAKKSVEELEAQGVPKDIIQQIKAGQQQQAEQE